MRGLFVILTHSTAEVGKQIGRVLAFHVDSCHLIHLYGYWITGTEQQGDKLKNSRTCCLRDGNAALGRN